MNLKVIVWVKGVIKTIAKLLRFIKQHLKAEKIFSEPEEAKIAILDASNVQYVIPLCGQEKYEIIYVNGEKLHLTWRILISFIRWIVRLQNPQAAYVIALIEHIKPNITLTFVDNASLFYEVSKQYKDCRFLAIQNAARYDTAHLEPEAAKMIHIPEFACFGEYEKDLYTRKGASVGQYYCIGSVRDSYYRSQHAQAQNNIDYDICVVAEPSPGWDKLEFPGFEDAIGNIAKYAVRFCKKHNLRLCIAGKRDPETIARDNELKWYEKYIDHDIEITPRVREQYTTYKLIDRSAVSVAFVSSALQEGIARGNRGLFCNFTKQSRWDFPVDGVWLLTDLDYDSFENRLLQILSMSDSDFHSISSGVMRYVTNYDENIPTHIFLEKLIAEAVGNPAIC